MKFESFKKHEVSTIKSAKIIKGGNCTQGESEHYRMGSCHTATDGMAIGSSDPGGDDRMSLYGDTTED